MSKIESLIEALQIRWKESKTYSDWWDTSHIAHGMALAVDDQQAEFDLRLLAQVARNRASMILHEQMNGNIEKSLAA